MQVEVRNDGATAAEGMLTASIDALTADVTFPSRVELPLTWTAIGSGGDAPLAYQFRYRNTAAGSWIVAQPWNASNVWT